MTLVLFLSPHVFGDLKITWSFSTIRESTVYSIRKEIRSKEILVPLVHGKFARLLFEMICNMHHFVTVHRNTLPSRRKKNLAAILLETSKSEFRCKRGKMNERTTPFIRPL